MLRCRTYKQSRVEHPARSLAVAADDPSLKPSHRRAVQSRSEDRCDESDPCALELQNSLSVQLKAMRLRCSRLRRRGRWSSKEGASAQGASRSDAHRSCLPEDEDRCSYSESSSSEDHEPSR